MAEVIKEALPDGKDVAQQAKNSFIKDAAKAMPVVEGVKGAEKVADNTPDRKNTPNTSKTDKTEGGENQKPANESGNDKKTTNEKDKTEGENTSKEKNSSDETEGRKVTREDNGQKTGSGVETSGEVKETKVEDLKEKIDDKGAGEAVEIGTGERLVPGTEGVVTGGDSTKLGKNMMKSMGKPRGTKWSGYQAQHIIPAEMANHQVLQKIGMDLDDASNGLFLRIPADDISTMSRHRGYHSTYNEFVKTQLDEIDINQSVDDLQRQVYDLQQNLKKLQQSGLPLYPNQGATVDMWQRSLERIQ